MAAAQVTLVEDDLLARLRQALTRAGQPHPVIDVQPWPGRPEEWRMVHPVGALLLMYRGGQFPAGPGLVQWSAEFELGLMVRNLRTHQARPGAPDEGIGAYDLLQAVRVALAGHEPPSAAGPVHVARESYTGRRDAVWAYAVRLAVPMVSLVQVPEAPGPWVSPVPADPWPALHTLELDHPDDYFPPTEPPPQA